jgi:AraC-like DNA-binding protein
MSHPPSHSLFARLAEPFTGEAIFDCFRDVVFFIKNHLGQYVVVNTTLVRRCGLNSKDELIGRRPDEVFPAPFGMSYRDQDEAILAGGPPISDQLELQLYPNRRPGWCLTSKLPLLDKQRHVAGLAGISRDLHVQHSPEGDYAHVAEAVRLIRTRFDQPLKVKQLAQEAGLSEYQFEQRIRKIFHITPSQLIQKVRMEAAVHRLNKTVEPIASIALACGYSDQSAFSRQFKQTVGLSPAEYRRATRAARESENEQSR